MSKGPTISMKKRMLIVVSVVTLIGFLTLIVRLVKIQILDGEMYSQQAAEQQVRDVQISAKRGSILDRNGKILAQSATVWNVLISPVDINRKDDKEARLIAKGLSEILEVDEEKIYQKTQNKKSYYEIIKKKVEKPVADEVRKFAMDNNIACIRLEEDTKRYYPYDNFASTLLGFVGTDNQGLDGLEAFYDKELKGTPGRVVSAKNAWGLDMPFQYEKMYEPKQGNNLVLTIDEVVQHFLEKHLEAAVKEHKVEARGVGIVMDVKTGEILAMSTKPDYNLNDPFKIYDEKAAAYLATVPKEQYNAELRKLQEAQWRNKAVSDPYEPGSVFKIITTSSALEEGTSKLNDTFTCPGFHIVAGRKISCWKHGGHGTQDFPKALMNSCNPALMMIGEKLGSQRYYKNFMAYGMGEKTGVDLPGEASNKGLYHELNQLGPVQLAVSSFGQTFKVTPIQLISGVVAAINGGNLMQPYIVKEIKDQNGNTVSRKEPTVKRQVISEQTSKEMCNILERAVKESSGSKNAYVPGYRVGGKSGTSEKIDDKNEQGVVDKFISSYLGFAPADDPRVAVLVLLDEPNSYSHFGSVIAAPTVSAVLADVLPYLGVEPRYTAEELKNIDISTPNLISKKVSAAQNELTNKNLKYRVVGDGETVVKQIPEPNSSIPKGATVILYTKEDAKEETTVVPNVLNLSASKANERIAAAGLNIKIVGSSTEISNIQAVSQSIPPGQKVPKGTIIEVTFRSIEEAQ